CQQGSSDPPTF
nr:immunoglobulin light chain junction region [Macaca mulatta]MOX07616.1 immunoglobulin light chain junction region [Macaca mulatta]MOX08244.1 immunoglobulin light chain junction region [Macaca mulatta]MOX09968.1 immunoglobulin light chain junction region [Macaca mulatta]MOX10635.1 immunoglobulin light chain junction region [Macaca mulatta]